jgi:hypothetical protein
MQRTRPAATGEPGASPSPRTILIADAAWDAVVGAALIAASAVSVTRPLGAGPLRPGPVPVALGAVCLAFAALVIRASTGTQAAAFCRLIAPGNAAGAIAALALLVAFPGAAHPYDGRPRNRRHRLRGIRHTRVPGPAPRSALSTDTPAQLKCRTYATTSNRALLSFTGPCPTRPAALTPAASSQASSTGHRRHRSARIVANIGRKFRRRNRR